MYNTNEIIYKEVKKSIENQSKDIEFISYKIISILFLSVFLILFSVFFHQSYLVITISLVSAATCLIGLQTNSYKQGPKLKEMHKKRNLEYIKFLPSFNKKVIEAIEHNKDTISRLGKIISFSSVCIFISLLALFISIL